ncbi:MAG TPA: hypothetical protein VK997_12610 [Deferrisomatales bacterium]|nr:hypothetical protein [Deferrisomatales bacterium]
MIRTLIAALLAGTVMASAQAFAAGYCDDPERMARWESMSRQYPDDYEIQTLDALRMGLCQKVRMGHLTNREMVRIFWSAQAQILAEGVSDDLASFLDTEADRKRRRQASGARLQRLQEAYETVSAAVRELDVESNAIRDDLRKERERYYDTCEESPQSNRRCQRALEKIEDYRAELEELQDDRERALRRQQAALEQLNQAKGQ